MQDDELILIYKRKLNLEDFTLTRIEHEDAIIATVYKVFRTNGREYILKIAHKTEHYTSEVYFLQYFLNKLPVPHIIDLVDPCNDLPGAILMEYLPGKLLNISELTNDQAFEAGSFLGTIHANVATGYGDLTQPNKLSSNSEPYFTMKFEEGLNECNQHLPHELILKSQYYFDENIILLASVDGPCITHRDFRPGNIIIQNEKIQGIIDWAGARASFAEEDFCPLEFGAWSNSDSIKKLFLEGYSTIRPVPHYSTIMPLLRLSRAIAIIGFTVRTNTWNTLNERLYKRNRQFIEDFFRSNNHKVFEI